MKRVLLLDLNYHLNRSCHVKAFQDLKDEYGRFTGAAFGLLNTIQLCLSRAAPIWKCIGVWDGGKSQRRLELFPPDLVAKTGYKATRGILPGMTPEEVAEKQDTLAKLESGRELATPVLMNSGVHIVTWPGREGDDVIALLAREIESRNIADEVVIASDDWDFAQCVTSRTIVYRAMAEQWLTMHNYMKTILVPVDWATVMKAVEGDKSDNIPGVDGIAEVYCAKAVRGFIEKVQPGFQEAWYEAHQYRDTRPADLTPFLDFCAADKRKRIQAISTQRDIFLRNVELVDLRVEQFPPEHIDMLLGSVLETRLFNEMLVARQLGELGVKSVLDNFSHWSAPFRKLC